jgi:hypothetical protein
MPNAIPNTSKLSAQTLHSFYEVQSQHGVRKTHRL